MEIENNSKYNNTTTRKTDCYGFTTINVMKLMEETAELKVKCECGTKQLMPVWRHTTICRNCGKKIRNNTKEYFKYQTRKKLKKLEDTYDKKRNI